MRPPQPAEPTAPAPAAPVPPAQATTASENPVAASESTAAAAPSSTTPLTAAAIEQLQTQLRDTQSTLEGHLERVQRLEGVLKEQESMRREVGRLRGVVDRVWAGEGSRVGIKRGLEEEDDDDEPGESDEEDDVRSVGTVVPHELERVEEEDEEALAEDENNEKEYHRRQQRAAKEGSDGDESDEGEQETEDRERRREEDLGVGRPRTPEPSRFGLGDSSRKVMSSSSSPLAHASSPPPAAAEPSDDVLHSQVEKLSKQVSAVLAFTTTLEAQHEMAQSTIRVLEDKVRALEGMLRESTVAAVKNDEDKAEADVPLPSGEEATTNPDVVDMPSITSLMSEWKKSVEGQWSSVQEEWSEERERLARAREEWEARARAVDSGLERMNGVQTSIVRAQEKLEVQLGAVIDHQGGTIKHNNITTNGGLATPPSPPRSQSSDSGKYARRRRRRRSSSSSSSSNAEPRSRSMSPSPSPTANMDSGIDMPVNDIDDAELSSTTLAEEDEDPAIAAVLPLAKAAFGGPAGNQEAERMLATPEPSVYKLDSSVNSLDSHPHPLAESTLGGLSEEVRYSFLWCLFIFF